MRIGKIEWTKARLDELQRLLDDGRTPKECGFALWGRHGIGRMIAARSIHEVIVRHGLRYGAKKVEKSAKFIAAAAMPEPEKPPVVYAWSFEGMDVEPGDGGGRFERISMGESMPRGGGD